MRWITIISLLFAFSLVSIPLIKADSQGTINASIKISLCGNELAEPGEDCDAGNNRSYDCHNLGFSGGSLSCGIGCNFDTSSCNIPEIDSSSVSPDEMDSLLATGLFSIPSTESFLSTSDLTAEEPITIIITGTTNSTVYLPEGVVINATDNSNFDPLSFVANIPDAAQVQSLPQNATSQAVLRWGIFGKTLGFSIPISITVNVGDVFNGQTLTIYRSRNLTSDWTDDGIVAPGTCLVENGDCSFLTTKASFFSVSTSPISTPTPTPTSTPTTSTSTTSTADSQSSTTTTSSSNPSTNTTTQPNLITKIIEVIITLPYALLQYDVNNNSRIDKTEVYNSVQIWVQNWQQYLQNGTLGSCELNYDGVCTLQDLSYLLFYVDR